MKENDKKLRDAEKAREVISKIDPKLLSAALSEIMIETDEAEEPDVERAKKSLKEIYDSIPEGKDKASIMSKAIAELDADTTAREVKVVKEKLANIDKETLIDAAKDYIDVDAICIYPVGGCWKYQVCSIYSIGDCWKYPVCSIYSINGCWKYQVCVIRVWDPPCHFCLRVIYDRPEIPDWEPYAGVKEKLKAEIIQELLQSPEINRAMKKMLTKIKNEG